MERKCQHSLGPIDNLSALLYAPVNSAERGSPRELTSTELALQFRSKRPVEVIYVVT
jgi:hypothetical protein